MVRRKGGWRAEGVWSAARKDSAAVNKVKYGIGRDIHVK